MSVEQGTFATAATRSGRLSRLPIWRPALDAVAAFCLFLFATMTLASAPSNAHPAGITPQFVQMHNLIDPAVADAQDHPIIEIATTSSPRNPDAVYRRTSSSAAWILLSLAFSVMAALNLAFIRHMRRAYAKPRNRTSG